MINYILLHPDSKCPCKKDNDLKNAGWDLFTPIDFDIFPGERRTIDTGVVCELPSDKWAHIVDKSKLARYNGLTVLGGVIDNNYRGTLGVVLLNTGNEVISFKKGDAIAQFVLHFLMEDETFNLVEELNTTNRGSKGIWSEGKR